MSSKMSPQDLLSASNKMFYIGFALLPLVWLTHILFVYPEVRKHQGQTTAQPSPASGQPDDYGNMMELVMPKLKQNVRNSAIGLFIYTAAFATWLALFITQRDQWQELGDQLCIEIPKG